MKFTNIILMAGALLISAAAAHIFFKAADEDPVEQALVLYQSKLDDTVKQATSGDVRAQHMAGELLRNAKKPIQNYSAAIKWYRKAAERGYSRSQFELGRMYAEGLGVRKNYARAADWFRLAANLSRHTGAQLALGDLYFHGRGVPSSYGVAIEWYSKAANQGDVAAQFILGQINKEGWGTDKNLIEAYKWISLSQRDIAKVLAHNERNDPKRVLAELKKQMHRSQIRLAEKALKAWKPKR